MFAVSRDVFTSCFLLPGLAKPRSNITFPRSIGTIFPQKKMFRTNISGLTNTNAWLIRSAEWWATTWAISWPKTAARPSSPLQIGKIPENTNTLPLLKVNTLIVQGDFGYTYPGITKAFSCGSSMTWTSQLRSCIPEDGISLSITLRTAIVRRSRAYSMPWLALVGMTAGFEWRK